MTYAVQCYLKAFLYDVCCAVYFLYDCAVLSQRHSSMTYAVQCYLKAFLYDDNAVQCYLKAFLYDQCCAVLSQGIPL